MQRIMTAIAITALLTSCASDPNRNTKRGAGIGAAAGAVAGAIIGNQSGNPQTGAAVGAAVGAGVGAAVGRNMDKQQQELQQIEGVEVTRTAENELNVALKNDVLFDFGSSSLRPESRTTLADMSSVFSRYPQSEISVEGHADSVGGDSANQNLSEQRARSVRDFLVQSGVSGGRIRSVGYGESRPRSSNDTAEGRQMNRRVEIRVRATEQS